MVVPALEGWLAMIVTLTRHFLTRLDVLRSTVLVTRRSFPSMLIFSEYFFDKSLHLVAPRVHELRRYVIADTVVSSFPNFYN